MKFERFHFSTESFKFRQRHADQKFNWFVLASPAGDQQMSKLSSVKRFMRSRSGRGFILHLGVCAMLSAAVAYGFHYFSLNWFVDHKSDETITAQRLADAFLTHYSAIPSQFGPNAPV